MRQKQCPGESVFSYRNYARRIRHGTAATRIWVLHRAPSAPTLQHPPGFRPPFSPPRAHLDFHHRLARDFFPRSLSRTGLLLVLACISSGLAVYCVAREEILLQATSHFARLILLATATLILLLLLGILDTTCQQRRLVASHRLEIERLSLAKRYEILVRHANDGIIIANAKHRIIDVNERSLSIYGYRRDEMLAMSDEELLPPDERKPSESRPPATSEHGPLLYELRQSRKDGGVFPAEISEVITEIDGEILIHKIVRDISERKTNEARLLQMSRLSTTLSAVNHAIAHASCAEEVFDIACRTCVQDGGFKLAWIGLVDRSNGLLRITNTWGSGLDFLEGILINTRSDLLDGSGPSAIAFREQRPYICGDFANDPITALWHEQAARCGIAASISLPISRDQFPMGVLTAYADHVSSFDPQARDLLGKIAESLSFSLHYFDERAAKRETESALKKREMQLLKAEEYARLGHWEVDLENGDTVWSPQMYSLFGRDPTSGPPGPNELYAGYYTPDSARLTEKCLREAISTGRRIQLEQELHLADERTAFHATLLVPIVDTQGRSIALHGTVQDVTERKQNEARLAKMASRLAQSAREYEDLYQNAPCGYHSLDHKGVFQRINDTELEWLGYTRDEVVGKMKFIDLLAPERVADFSQTFPILMRGGRLSDLEQNLICKDGSHLPVLINATAIHDNKGKFLMSRSTTYNMTERKKVEREKEEYITRLAQLSRGLVHMQEEERRRLSASLHDRTSPNLAAIGLNLSIIGMSSPQALTPALAERLEDIRALLEDTTASIREISADLRPPLLDYAGLVPALESYLYQFSKRTGTATRFESELFAGRVSPELESLLFRVTQEALTNCAKHATASLIEVALINDQGKVTLTVYDNGRGFDLASVGKRDGSIGQGLLNMREMTEFAGGQFTLETRPGKGALIRVEI